jgi:hypothetical protein
MEHQKVAKKCLLSVVFFRKEDVFWLSDERQMLVLEGRRGPFIMKQIATCGGWARAACGSREDEEKEQRSLWDGPRAEKERPGFGRAKHEERRWVESANLS